MRNLFVLHTQYNLILGTGLAHTVFAKDTNHLILFQDFNISDMVRDSLTSSYQEILFLTGAYPKINEQYWNKIRRYPVINHKLKQFIKNDYDRVILVEDMCIPEMYIMKYSGRVNEETEFIWLEDGSTAYFSNGVVSGGMGANRMTRMFRKIIFKYIFCLNKYYDLNYYMGGHCLLKHAYVSYPQYVQEQYKSMELTEIPDEAFEAGIKKIYFNMKNPFYDKGILFVLDLLHVYGDKRRDVELALEREIQNAHENGLNVYYKYHPRETEVLDIFCNEVELERSISMEGYLSCASGKQLRVIGIKSTGLQTAKKMGFETVSLIRLVDGDCQVSDFYKKIGIICL